ncbi:MAG: hypothetical protein V3V78_01220 [Candidatus Woesearchaeota archaeon]
MSEKQLVIDGLELHYDGLFDLKELLKAIDKYTRAKGYSKSEKRRQELVKKTGKEFSIELRPTKLKTEYYTLQIKIRINISNLEEAMVVKDDKKKKLNKGHVVMIFDAWAITDYEHRWAKKPYYYFGLILVDRFFKKMHSDKFHGEVIDDTHYIHENIKAHLSLYRY